jgi:hypothetical protein
MGIEAMVRWSRGYVRNASDSPASRIAKRSPLMARLQFWEHMLTRRQFLKASAGASYLAVSSGFWFVDASWSTTWPARARVAPWLTIRSRPGLPRPIPGGIEPQIPGAPRILHIYRPQHGYEPSTITDFMGSVGLAHLRGAGMRTDLESSVSQRLFYEADVRFMKGRYVDVNGRPQSGTFASVCLDLFQDRIDFEHQLHNFSPGIHPNGLCWTTPVTPASVRISLNAGAASMSVHQLPLLDFYAVPNGVAGGPSFPATVSFKIQWSGSPRRVRIHDRTTVFTGAFMENLATIEWAAQSDHYHFVSDSAAHSKSQFALIGYEQNGIYSEKHQSV